MHHNYTAGLVNHIRVVSEEKSDAATLSNIRSALQKAFSKMKSLTIKEADFRIPDPDKFDEIEVHGIIFNTGKLKSGRTVSNAVVLKIYISDGDIILSDYYNAVDDKSFSNSDPGIKSMISEIQKLIDASK